jgi:hypothetical protein
VGLLAVRAGIPLTWRMNAAEPHPPAKGFDSSFIEMCPYKSPLRIKRNIGAAAQNSPLSLNNPINQQNDGILMPRRSHVVKKDGFGEPP